MDNSDRQYAPTLALKYHKIADENEFLDQP